MPDLGQNLVYLCSHYPSISDVCRRLDINRQQFNKYISGVVTPSTYNIKRISDFFGIDMDTILLPHDKFKQVIEIGRALDQRDQGLPNFPEVEFVLSTMRDNSKTLENFIGYYYRYYYAFDMSGRVVNSLFRISESDGVFLTRHIERVGNFANTSANVSTFRFRGVATCMSNCVFVIEFETMMRSCMSNLMFPIIPRPAEKYLFGLQSGLSMTLGRPASSRVVLERLRPGVSVREMLANCGVFAPDHPNIPPEILPLISNESDRSDRPVLPHIS